MKILWIDDIRNPPAGMVSDIARNYAQAMDLLVTNTYRTSWLPWATCANLLVGTPCREYNERLLLRLGNERAQLWGDESPTTILSPTVDELNSQLPRYAIMLLLDCTVPISAGDDGSRLRLVYFADTIPNGMPEYLRTTLQNLDWKSHARDYEL